MHLLGHFFAHFCSCLFASVFYLFIYFFDCRYFNGGPPAETDFGGDVSVCLIVFT